MSYPIKDEMESTYWSSDLIEVKTKSYTINGLPKPSLGSCETQRMILPTSRLTHVASSLACFQCTGLEWGRLAWVEASPHSWFSDLGLASLFGGQAG